MKNLKFIETLAIKGVAMKNPTKDQLGHVYKVIHDAVTGKIASSDSETTTPQQACYIAHAGQCGDCDINGGWTGC